MSRTAFKRPESVLVVVITADDWVLLLERTRPSGFWQSVTGALRWAESPRRAAQRELYEETGLSVGAQLVDMAQQRRFRIVGPWRERYSPCARYNREHWFVVRLPSRRQVRINPKEHTNWRWVRAGQAARQVSSWSNRELIEQLAGP